MLPNIKATLYVFQDPRVLDAMLPYLVHYYGNPHSRTHAYGWESEDAMERAREVAHHCLWWLIGQLQPHG